MPGWKREGVLMLLAGTVNTLAVSVAWLGLFATGSLSGDAHLLLAVCVLFAGGLPLFVHRVMRQRTQPGDPVLLPIVFVLSGVGLANLLGVSGDISFVTRHCLGLFAGAVLVVLIAMLDGARWRVLISYHYLWAMLALLLGLLLLLFGKGPGGTRLQLMGFLPVEVIKLLLVLFAAGYAVHRFGTVGLARASGRWWQVQWHELLPLLVMFALLLSVFVLARDFGPALTLYLTLLVMLFLVTGRVFVLLLGVVLMTVGVVFAEVIGIGVLPTRIAMWLSPWQVTQEHARHLAHSLWSFSSGGIFGSGIGLGKPYLVPHARSDSVFSAWAEQLGLVGTLCLLCLYALWVGRAIRIAQRANSIEYRLLAAGIASLQAMQVIVICAGIVGLSPLTGMSLPFIAQGNSALLANFAMAGLLYSISSYSTSHSAPTSASRYRSRLHALGLAFTVLILGAIGARCFWLQSIKADDIAAQPLTVRVPKSVPHRVNNPRLDALAKSIPRGRILDTTGAALAATQDGRRIYPCGEACAQLVGWLDDRFGGPTGAEARYQKQLRGYTNTTDLVRLYRRKDLPFFRLPHGKDIMLTISMEAQQEALKALRQVYPKGHGAFVLLEAETGRVVTAVGTPTFDPNRLNAGVWQRLRQREDAPLVFRPVDGLYPPGSTFKVVTAAAALERGVALRHRCGHQEKNIRWKVGERSFSKASLSDHPAMRAHGTIGLRDAVRLSCNLYFAHLAIRLNPDALHETARLLGIERVPAPDQMARELPDYGFGQGKLLVSPLEMASVMATIARSGRWQKAVFTPRSQPAKSVLSEDTAEALRQMLYAVVDTGTAQGTLSGTGWDVYGKTGTAETEEGNRKPHGWFAGVVRADNSPPLAFALVLEHGGSGRQAAIASRKILQRVLPTLNRQRPDSAGS